MINIITFLFQNFSVLAVINAAPNQCWCLYVSAGELSGARAATFSWLVTRTTCVELPLKPATLPCDSIRETIDKINCR